MAANNNPRQIINKHLRCSSKRHEGDRLVPLKEFCKSKTPDGYSYSCKLCRTKENKELCNARYKRWKEKDPIKAMLQGIKGNATKKSLPCTVTIDDLIVPATCPILGIPLAFSEKRTYNTPSVDRIDNSKGYTADNIVICSWRANMLKKDATLKELKQLSEYYTLLEETTNVRK